MENEQRVSGWQNWALIGLRCAFLIFVALELFNIQSPDGAVYPQNEIVIALIIGVVSTIFLVIPILFPSLNKIMPPVLLFSDWLLIALLTYTIRTEITLSVALAGLLIVTSVLRLGASWGSVHAVGIVLILALVRGEIYRLYGETPGTLPMWVPLSIVAMFGLVANVWSYALQRQIKAQESQILEEQSSKQRQLSAMKDRTRVIYEMAAVLGSTLNYEKILQAAMNVGWLGLRDRGREIEERLCSMVLLYRSGDNQLHVAAARGLTRRDEDRITPGTEGIIGEALNQTIPTFGDNPRKDPELSNFVAFQTARSVMCVPLRAGYDNYGVMVYGSPFPDAFTDEHTELLTAIGTTATIALQNAHLYQNLLEERDKIVDVEEEARKKLARDLHDGPTQDVSAIAMRMSIIQKLLVQKPQDVPAELQKVEEIARKTTKEIRHMLFTLRPLVLENQGLAAALNQLSDKMKETHNQAVTIRVARDAERILDQHQQGVIFYIVEEAVGNARKHAKADMITVSVFKQDEAILVNISDNGVGFDTTEAEKKAMERGGHLGMINLRERAEMLGGTLRMESAPGRGTSITVFVPIKDVPRNTASERMQRQITGKTSKLEAAALERVRQSPNK
ncbi:MAG: GAF domain-containing sensor histidine kinase [Anaerolineae bacterium]|nr:GAF domain-containing sensor histidine kinase [Anaerolineae bacterium]